MRGNSFDVINLDQCLKPWAIVKGSDVFMRKCVIMWLDRFVNEEDANKECDKRNKQAEEQFHRDNPGVI